MVVMKALLTCLSGSLSSYVCHEVYLEMIVMKPLLICLSSELTCHGCHEVFLYMFVMKVFLDIYIVCRK